MKIKENSLLLSQQRNAADHLSSDKQAAPPALNLTSDSIQMQPLEEEEEMLQAKMNSGPFQLQVEEEEEMLQAKKSKYPNQNKFNNSITRTNMPENVQAKMESSFNADFSRVNIYSDSSKALSIGAQAFAQGNDIHFAPGKYEPQTQSGQELLGHELTHIVQQRDGRVQPTAQRRGKNINDNPGLEQEADELGKKAANGEKIDLLSSSNQDNAVTQPIQAFGFGDATEWLSEKSSDAWEGIKSGMGWAADKIGGAAENTMGWASDKVGSVRDKAVDMAGGAMDAIPAVKSFVSLACNAIEDILNDPVGFLKNIIEAIKNGFGQFFGNLTQHLLSGLTDWIFNAAQSAGIQFPSNFNIEGIMSLIKQIISTLWNYVKERILKNIKKINEKIGDTAAYVVQKVIAIAPIAILDALKKLTSKASITQ